MSDLFPPRPKMSREAKKVAESQWIARAMRLFRGTDKAARTAGGPPVPMHAGTPGVDSSPIDPLQTVGRQWTALPSASQAPPSLGRSGERPSSHVMSTLRRTLSRIATHATQLSVISEDALGGGVLPPGVAGSLLLDAVKLESQMALLCELQGAAPGQVPRGQSRHDIPVGQAFERKAAVSKSIVNTSNVFDVDNGRSSPKIIEKSLEEAPRKSKEKVRPILKTKAARRGQKPMANPRKTGHKTAPKKLFTAPAKTESRPKFHSADSISDIDAFESTLQFSAISELKQAIRRGEAAPRSMSAAVVASSADAKSSAISSTWKNVQRDGGVKLWRENIVPFLYASEVVATSRVCRFLHGAVGACVYPLFMRDLTRLLGAYRIDQLGSLMRGQQGDNPAISGSICLKAFTGLAFKADDVDIFHKELPDAKRTIRGRIRDIPGVTQAGRTNGWHIYSSKRCPLRVFNFVQNNLKIQTVGFVSDDWTHSERYVDDVFDIHPCKVCWNGLQLTVSPSCLASIFQRRVLFQVVHDTNYRPGRPFKYAKRGFRMDVKCEDVGFCLGPHSTWREDYETLAMWLKTPTFQRLVDDVFKSREFLEKCNEVLGGPPHETAINLTRKIITRRTALDVKAFVAASRVGPKIKPLNGFSTVIQRALPDATESEGLSELLGDLVDTGTPTARSTAALETVDAVVELSQNVLKKVRRNLQVNKLIIFYESAFHYSQPPRAPFENARAT